MLGSILGELVPVSQNVRNRQPDIDVGYSWPSETEPGYDTTATALAWMASLWTPTMGARKSEMGPPLVPGAFLICTRTAAASLIRIGVLVVACMPAGVPAMFHQPVVMVLLASACRIDWL